jgi:hypothetical protein
MRAVIGRWSAKSPACRLLFLQRSEGCRKAGRGSASTLFIDIFIGDFNIISGNCECWKNREVFTSWSDADFSGENQLLVIDIIPSHPLLDGPLAKTSFPRAAASHRKSLDGAN